jgi:hypothetical protein
MTQIKVILQDKNNHETNDYRYLIPKVYNKTPKLPHAKMLLA